MRKILSFLAFSLPLCSQNAALPPDVHTRFLDNSGKPLAGGLIYTCQAGTTCPGTPLDTYTDSTAAVQNPNPIILDSGGYAPIFIGGGSYKFVVQNSSGVQQWTADNITNLSFSIATSLSGNNSASALTYTPARTGGQTRTLQAIQADEIDAANYDSITHAFADACTSTPGKLVFIPATIAGTQSYTNACKAPVYDQRQGTIAAPTTGRTFWSPSFGGTFYDASARTTDSASQGDGSYAPINSVRVFETGAATAAALYTEYHASTGATGGAYGLSANVSADPGSAPAVVAHNWTIQDASHTWISGCSRASGVATCTLTGVNPFFLPSSTGCFYVNGTTDTSFTKGGTVQCANSWTGTSVSFNNAGSNTSIGAGGWISPAHQVFGFELNSNNASHDPTHINELLGNPLPVWGFVSQNTPFTWSNPTGGADIPNMPLSAGFFASGSSSITNAGQYTGFLAQDAIDDLFTAGYPQVSGSISTANSGFRARPIGAAVNTPTLTNYRSQKSCWDTSIANGVSSLNDSTYCMWYEPLANSANSDSVFKLGANGWTPIQLTKTGHVKVDSASTSEVSYGFAGWTNGIYNVSGTTTNFGPFAASGTINAVGGFQANGTAGLNTTINVRNAANTGACTLTVTGGLITATTCP